MERSANRRLMVSQSGGVEDKCGQYIKLTEMRNLKC